MKGEFQEGYLYGQGRPPVWGEEIIRCLLRMNKALDAQFLEEIAVCDMKVSEGCTAVLAWETRRGRFLEVTSGAAVLAMGGAGALFLRSGNPAGNLSHSLPAMLEGLFHRVRDSRGADG